MSILDRVHALAPVIGQEVADEIASLLVGESGDVSEVESAILVAVANAVREHGARGIVDGLDAITEALGDEPDFVSLFSSLGPREASDLMAAFQSAELADLKQARRWIEVFGQVASVVILAILEGAR